MQGISLSLEWGKGNNIRQACLETPLFNSETCIFIATHMSKHPDCCIPLRLKVLFISSTMLEQGAICIIKSFPNESAGSLDGLIPQHCKDLSEPYRSTQR